MKIFTRILKNIGIILAIFLCVALVTFAYMFFSQKPVFGYRVRVYSTTGVLTGADRERINLQTGYNEKTKSTKASLIGGFVDETIGNVDEYTLLINKVVIETTSIPVSIVGVMPAASGEEKSHITFTDRILSFVKQDDLDSKDNPYRLFATANNGELRITINECPGFAIIGDSVLEVGIDFRFFKSNDTSIEVITENSNVSIKKGANGNGVTAYQASNDELDSLKVTNLKMRAKDTKVLFGGRGTFTSNINIEKLNIENIDGVINLKNADILDYADITTKTGNITFGTVTSTNPKAIKIRSDNSQVTFDTINGGFSYTGYDTAALKEDRILESKGGKITGKQILGGLFLKTKNAKFSTTYVKGQVTAEISGSGTIDIKLYNQDSPVSVESSIIGAKGKIGITNIINANNLKIKTKSGEISVSASTTETDAILHLETEKGKLTYNGHNNVTGVNSQNQLITGGTTAFSGKLTIKIVNSKKVNLSNITGGCLFNISASKKMEATIKLGTFASGSEIYTDNGKLNVTFKNDANAYLAYNGEKKPGIDIRTVKSLSENGVPTPICGATTPINIGDDAGKSPLITITNVKGSSNLHI